MKVFLNIGFFIFVINGYLNPIFSFQNKNHNIFINQKKTNVPKLKDTTVFVNWRDRPYSIDNSRRPGTETKRKFLPF